jgi:2-aminoadipate transaminase
MAPAGNLQAQPGAAMSSSAATVCLNARDLLARRAAETPGLISFAGGLPDPALFPKRQLTHAFVSALQSNAAAALQYGWPEGSLELRQWIADELCSRGARVTAERIIITSGAQQAIQIAVASVRDSARIAVEAESYPGALEIFRSARAQLVPLTDPAGLYYVMPSVSNPRGSRMPVAERRALLARASLAKGFIIEDDAYQGTCFTGARPSPLLAAAPERVFHVGTFSKTLCPGLRIGWLVPPPRLAKRALRHKQASDLQANGLAQALVLEYLRTGHFPKLQKRARAHYHRKLERLLEAVQRELPQFRCDEPIGGFSLWLESEQEADDTELLEAAVQQGVSFDLGRQFRLGRARNLCIRLCFSAVPAGDIESGVSRIARALRRVLYPARPHH